MIYFLYRTDVLSRSVGRSDWMSIPIERTRAIESLRAESATEKKEKELLDLFRQADRRKQELILRFSRQLTA